MTPSVACLWRPFSCQIMQTMALLVATLATSATLGLQEASAAQPGGPKPIQPWTLPTPGHKLAGLATYMNPGRMEQSARNTNRSLDGVVGGLAMNRKGDIGRLVWLEHDGTITGPYKVVDCAQQGAHYEAREAAGRIVEVTYELADDWMIVGIGPTPVTVWFTNPFGDLTAPGSPLIARPASPTQPQRRQN